MRVSVELVNIVVTLNNIPDFLEGCSQLTRSEKYQAVATTVKIYFERKMRNVKVSSDREWKPIDSSCLNKQNTASCPFM